MKGEILVGPIDIDSTIPIKIVGGEYEFRDIRLKVDLFICRMPIIRCTCAYKEQRITVLGANMQQIHERLNGKAKFIDNEKNK